MRVPKICAHFFETKIDRSCTCHGSQAPFHDVNSNGVAIEIAHDNDYGNTFGNAKY